MRTLAKHLLDLETPGSKSSSMRFEAAAHASDKLRPRLVTLYGTAGYRSLLSRALLLAESEVSWLREVHLNADGSLEGLDAIQAQMRPRDVLEGRIVLLARLLGLLEAYIGPLLTLRILSEIWPQFPAKCAGLERNGTK